MLYLDSSALVKLVVVEPESAALESWLGARTDLSSCALSRTEVRRAVRPSGPDAVARATRLLATTALVQLDDALFDRAGDLEPPLRSLDAIHLAAALELGDELETVVTYDARMTKAARALGLPVVAPA